MMTKPRVGSLGIAVGLVHSQKAVDFTAFRVL